MFLQRRWNWRSSTEEQITFTKKMFYWGDDITMLYCHSVRSQLCEFSFTLKYTISICLSSCPLIERIIEAHLITLRFLWSLISSQLAFHVVVWRPSSAVIRYISFLISRDSASWWMEKTNEARILDEESRNISNRRYSRNSHTAMPPGCMIVLENLRFCICSGDFHVLKLLRHPVDIEEREK